MNTVTLRQSKYAKLYSWVVEDIKDRYEIRIIHRKLTSAFGHCDFEKRVITIDKEIKGTVFGIWTARHECQHIIDCSKGLYPDFYGKILHGNIEDLNIEKIVWEAEWHCCAMAVKHLKKLGIDIHNKFCNKNWLKKYILPIWVDYYRSK